MRRGGVYGIWGHKEFYLLDSGRCINGLRNVLRGVKMDEKKLVEEYKRSSERVDALDSQLKEAKKELDKTEHELLELMENSEKERTATYEGVGFVTRMKPKLYASYTKEHEEELFAYLTSMGREDLIKPKVHASSLSSFVAEKIEEGDKLPEFISYYLKPGLNLYKK